MSYAQIYNLLKDMTENGVVRIPRSHIDINFQWVHDIMQNFKKFNFNPRYFEYCLTKGLHSIKFYILMTKNLEKLHEEKHQYLLKKIIEFDDSILDILQIAGFDFDGSENGITLLMRTCWMLMYPANLVENLISHGANVNAQNTVGYTAISYAATFQCPHLDRLQVLLDNGADVNIPNDAGRTALIIAAGDGESVEMVKMLLNHGADKTLKDHDGKTALDYAIKPEIKELLSR